MDTQSAHVAPGEQHQADVKELNMDDELLRGDKEQGNRGGHSPFIASECVAQRVEK